MTDRVLLGRASCAVVKTCFWICKNHIDDKKSFTEYDNHFAIQCRTSISELDIALGWNMNLKECI